MGMKHIISFIIRKVPRKYLQLFSHLVLKVLKVFYRGSGYTCNVCGKSFRKFLPYGRINPRSNALCPNCLALERHRLMWLYLQEKTDFFTIKHKLLHIAPEICFIDKFKSMKNLEYTTADLESPLADVQMDIHHMPFDSNSFDVVFCNHVMEHLENDIQAMKEIRRVLVTGGWAIIQSPQDFTLENTYEDASIVSPKDREKAYGQDDHMRTYGMDYGKRLSSAGFEVLADNFVKNLPGETVKKHALPPDEIIYFCKKK
jgi:SAM-dependent methyltransferase